MTSDLLDLLDPGAWPVLALVSARIGGLFLVAPLWSMTAIPGRLRAAMAVAVTAGLLPPAIRQTTLPPPEGVAMQFAAEFLIGLVIGLVAVVFLHGIAMAADVVSLQMGLSLGATLMPMSDITSPGIGELKGFFTLAMYVALGGHLALIEGLGHSLHALPPGLSVELAGGARAALEAAGTVFATAARAAAPMMVALFVTHVALAILNRAVPQLNTMMVSIPVTIAIGLVMLAASLPYTAVVVAEWANSISGTADGMIAALRPVPGPR